MDSYLVNYFQSALDIEKSVGAITESIDRRLSPSAAFTTDLPPLEIEENSSEDIQIQIQRLQREISSMDRTIDDNDEVITRQAKSLEGVLSYLGKIHSFNNEFTNAILTLTPIKKNNDTQDELEK